MEGQAVENNKFWFDKVPPTLPENGKVTFKQYDRVKNVNSLYAESINDTDIKWGVVIVDRWDRVNCVKNAVDWLSERDIIILDDSSRQKYEEGWEYLFEKGLREITFSGLKPTGFLEDSTTIFYRENNCFNI